MRDRHKLRAFELADQLALLVYEHTRDFPRSEQFGLTSQMRRAAVSVPSNIVEGCGRESLADYIRFLDIAYGSVRELEYQLSLTHRLGFLKDEALGDDTDGFRKWMTRWPLVRVRSARDVSRVASDALNADYSPIPV